MIGSISSGEEFYKATCLELLEKADDIAMWDAFLEGQTKLFFDGEFQLIPKEIFGGNSVLTEIQASKVVEKIKSIEKNFHNKLLIG